MAKLTKAQREWLTWVRDAGGVTDVSDKRIANPLGLRGYVIHWSNGDCWSITELGRAALKDGQAE